jgi:hypothetical protein
MKVKFFKWRIYWVIVLNQNKMFSFLGLWIQIDSIRIRIQHFSSLRIQKNFESGSNADPDPQRKIWRQIFVLSFKNQYESQKYL